MKISVKVLASALVVAAAFIGYEIFLNPTSALLWKLHARPAYMSVDESKPLNEQVRRITMGGRTFDIPIMYVDSQFDDGLEQSGVNFKIYLPDFTSIHDFNDRAEYDAARKSDRLAFLLVRPAATQTPLAQMIQNSKKNGNAAQFIHHEYGLEKYVDIQDPEHPTIQWEDTYLENDNNGKLVSFLRCSPEGKVPVPGCSHYFIDKGVLFDFNYRKNEHLKDWQKLRSKVIQFMDSFEVKTNP